MGQAAVQGSGTRRAGVPLVLLGSWASPSPSPGAPGQAPSVLGQIVVLGPEPGSAGRRGPGQGSWRPLSVVLMMLCVLVGVLVFAVSPALAGASRGVVGFFGGTGTTGGLFSTPGGVAVNDDVRECVCRRQW